MEQEPSTAPSPAMSDKKGPLDVVQVENDDNDVAHKARLTEFIAPLKRGGGPSYNVTVPIDFMSLGKSMWPEAEIFLFPYVEECQRERTLPEMMSVGLEIVL